MSWIKRRLSPSLVISIIALCVALGGTAFALASDSVGARELRPIVVRAQDQPVGAGETSVIDVQCASGQQLTGGGIEELTHSKALVVEDSHPHHNGWEGTVTNTGPNTRRADAEALCLKK